MRVETAVQLRRGRSVTPLRRRIYGFVAVLMASVLLACSGDPEITAPGPTLPALGWLTGTVTLLGNDGPTHPPGYLTLYASPEDLAQRNSRYGGTLYRRDGDVRAYDFFVANVLPGDYYVLFCWTIGCGEYRQPETGALRTVRIRPARGTRLNFGL